MHTHTSLSHSLSLSFSLSVSSKGEIKFKSFHLLISNLRLSPLERSPLQAVHSRGEMRCALSPTSILSPSVIFFLLLHPLLYFSFSCSLALYLLLTSLRFFSLCCISLLSFSMSSCLFSPPLPSPHPSPRPSPRPSPLPSSALSPLSFLAGAERKPMAPIASLWSPGPWLPPPPQHG